MTRYRIYIDESGNPDSKVGADSPHRYLSLTGVMIDEDYARTVVVPTFNKIKSEHFGHWPHPVIFHRKDIVNKVGPFAVLQDPEKEKKFNSAILSAIAALNYTVITVMIDKHAHKEKYSKWLAHPYHYCMEVITEKYAQWLIRKNGVGDVVAEARTAQVDKKLKNAFRYYYRNGTRFIKKDKMQSLIASHELKVFRKEKNIAALQLSDLLAHPSAASLKAIRFNEPLPKNFGGMVADILIRQKYDRSWFGKIDGYGRKWLP